jgi:hypothetical protein
MNRDDYNTLISAKAMVKAARDSMEDGEPRACIAALNSAYGLLTNHIKEKLDESAEDIKRLTGLMDHLVDLHENAVKRQLVETHTRRKQQ